MAFEKTPVAVITDHGPTNRSLGTALDPERFAVHVLASDRPDLLEKLHEIAPILLFLRVRLRSASGLELCDLVRSQPALEDMRVVLLSPEASDREAAVRHRASHFQPLPLSAADARELVDRLIGHQPTILFVDDSKLQHGAVVPHLLDEGYRVTEVWNGQEALDVLATERFDLVITDLEMPVMDGFELCRTIKAGEADQCPPVLISSTLDAEDEVRRGFESGADDYIVKPIVAAEMLSRVERLLGTGGPRRPERILVADASAVSRSVVVKALESQGFQVDTADDGQEALNRMATGEYHLACVDFELPVVDGYQFCLRLRDSRDQADVPVVMTSSRGSMADQVKVRSAGIHAFIVKPFKAERLIAEVERVLAEVRLDRQRQSMRLYLSDTAAEAVDRLSQDAGSVDTSARDEFRTVLFTDICAFTPLCSKLPPGQIVELLNEYFDVMVSCLNRHGAVIDKFIGDAIMALFDREGDGACRAVRCASEMIEELPALRDRTGSDLHMRVGINSGHVVMGDIGSRLHRRDFTVIGDNVNVAQRLESAADRDGILVSDSTYQLVEDIVVAEQTEPLQLKGKEESVRAWRIRSVQRERREERGSRGTG